MCSTSHAARGLKNGFEIESFGILKGALERWELNEDLREARKSVLPFIWGLRFSALLIYRIRKVLRGSSLKASWGAILSDAGGICSPECDVIVHEGESAYVWNGDDAVDDRVMDFHFVPRDQARLVISCKQRIRSVGAKMRRDAFRLMEYVPRVWLFAVCCKEGRQEDLERQARKAGYERFWWLYSLAKGGMERENEPGWAGFVEELRRIDTQGHSGV